ncbi:MAG: lytic transglycosylase domain-containing protein [Myxococcales bacterium]|nr:lytic transglycosylase domain-containing protein [Myxococcales bacterium]
MLILALCAAAPARDLYTYTAPDGTVVLTDTPDHAGFEKWWSEGVPGSYLPNGVAMPRLDRIGNLDAFDAWFLESAVAEGLPAELLKAVAVAESRMNPSAVSRAGAKGLMQIMPATAKSLGVKDPFDPRESISGGAAYLARQVARFGSYERALAAYNAGPKNVEKFGGIPPFDETRTYVARVIGLYEHFRDNRKVTR